MNFNWIIATMTCGMAATSCACTQCDCGMLVTKQTPLWSGKAAINGEIKDLSSSAYKGKFQVLLFYPLDFTFVCPTELIAFNDRHSEFEKLGAQVIGVSVDSEYSHLAWSRLPRKEGGLSPIKIPLLSDITKDLARKFGVLYENSVALRGLFIIDGNGKVRHSTINDLPIGRNVDEVLRVIEAVQFSDKHGEVCPANWKSGEKGMKADPVGSKEYFSEL